MANRKSTTGFPTSYRRSAFVTPVSPKGWPKSRREQACSNQLSLTAHGMGRLLLRPGRGVEHCDQFVCLYFCLSVCVREHISGTAGPIFTKFFVQIPCGRGSVLVWRRCDTLCTFSFMDDVTFGRNMGRMAMCGRLNL